MPKKNDDILKIGKTSYQFAVGGFYLNGKKYLAAEVLKNPEQYKEELNKLAVIPGQNILKEI